ncbi:MAG: nitrous oxide reductase family maturation protein NosD [Promethearchaeota archaeon]
MYKIKILEKRKLKALGFLIILVGVSTFVLYYGFSQNKLKLVEKTNISEENFSKLKISTVVSPISIDDSNPSIDWDWAVTQSWCTGSGTASDPYLLENLEIDGLGGDCISIQNSNAYFIIRTCTLYNAGTAVYLYNVANGTVIENDCSDNSGGVYVEYSSHNEVIGNDLYGNSMGTGINLLYSSNNIVEENIVDNNYQGIRLEGADDNTILGNVANNNSNFGILLIYSSDNNIIKGNIQKLQKYYTGMYLVESDSNIISENSVSDNPYSGIVLDGSYDNLLSGNSIFNNQFDGIFIGSDTSSGYSDSNNITLNTIYNNTDNGITLDDDCWYNIIWDNDIYDNGMNGLNFANSWYDDCYGNVIRDNIDMGIYVSTSSGYISFYENFFHRNGKHAVDDGFNDDWNNTVIGNYWDNYTGTDGNNDGIGDVPHDFGTGIDYLPIVDNANPIVTINSPNPNDAFDNAPSFSLTINEDYLFYMWYTLDGGVKIYFTEFTGTIDQVAWDALADGNITLTFYANDKAENSATPAEVIISKDTQAPIIVITKPTPDKKISSNFGFELDITEPHLDAIWYSLDGGVTNFTAETPTEKITKAAWATAAKGEVTVTFYASDTLGHIGSESVTIRKVSPTIGLDYVTTSILILAISGVAIIAIISKIHSKKRIISN